MGAGCCKVPLRLIPGSGTETHITDVRPGTKFHINREPFIRQHLVIVDKAPPPNGLHNLAFQRDEPDAPSLNGKLTEGWQRPSLTVPQDPGCPGEAPVPPPRKKRRSRPPPPLPPVRAHTPRGSAPPAPKLAADEVPAPGKLNDEGEDPHESILSPAHTIDLLKKMQAQDLLKANSAVSLPEFQRLNTLELQDRKGSSVSLPADDALTFREGSLAKYQAGEDIDLSKAGMEEDAPRKDEQKPKKEHIKSSQHDEAAETRPFSLQCWEDREQGLRAEDEPQQNEVKELPNVNKVCSQVTAQPLAADHNSTEEPSTPKAETRTDESENSDAGGLDHSKILNFVLEQAKESKDEAPTTTAQTNNSLLKKYANGDVDSSAATDVPTDPDSPTPARSSLPNSTILLSPRQWKPSSGTLRQFELPEREREQDTSMSSPDSSLRLSPSPRQSATRKAMSNFIIESYSPDPSEDTPPPTSRHNMSLLEVERGNERPGSAASSTAGSLGELEEDIYQMLSASKERLDDDDESADSYISASNGDIKKPLSNNTVMSSAELVRRQQEQYLQRLHELRED